jgi:hypothetical protein
MIDFLKSLPYKSALMVYTVVFLLLTILSKYLGHDWYGFKFSIPIILTILIVDLLATYKLYKKWRQN